MTNDHLKELSRTMALCKAYDVCSNTHCVECGLPATIDMFWCTEMVHPEYGKSLYNHHVSLCDVCKIQTTETMLNVFFKDRPFAKAVRRLMRIAKDEP